MRSIKAINSISRKSRYTMAYDLTLKTYEELCKAISAIQKDCRFIHYLENKEDSHLILRHDVDRKPKNALRMARLEYRQGLRATYYFRCVPASFNADIIREISGIGHEVGYHYEVMAKAKGDVQRAKKIFFDDLERLRLICEVRTACMHGSPSSDKNNIDFWNYANLSDFELLGEAFSNIRGEFHYFTDTGGKWNSNNNIRDKVSNCVMPTTHTTRRIISDLTAGSKIYINCHPERWAGSFLEIPSYVLKDYAINIAKRVLH